MVTTKSLILNSQQIEQKVNRMAWEIYECNSAETEVILVGIRPNGSLLAKRIGDVLGKISPIKVSLHEIHIQKENPADQETKLDIPLEKVKGKAIVVVDDVLNSGKTLIYGVKPFLAVPLRRLQTAVLVDRNHNRYPIKSDYTGLSLATTLQEHISVELDKPGQEAVYLM